ncbi:MAG: MBL fold metallo-hydrolase [Acidobacteria bacterium]|nr:MBL fold metallo-hydrolase [Acidobacteriota bacterium]
MTLRPFLFCLALTIPTAAPAQAPPAAAQPAEPMRTITQVRGDLYKVQSGTGVSAVTVFLVTPEGIILADPLNPEFAAWLKAELAARFPGRPVRYVIYSHYHWDHARGGGMFADTARFVAHENMPMNLARPIAQARPPGDTDDVDGDGRLTREEAQTATRANFDRFDGNGDGLLTQAEIGADIRRPDITFSGDRSSVTLGGKRVELIHAKNRHTDDLIDMYFPEERVLFTGDYVWTNRLCCNFAFDRRPMTPWIESIRALEPLDFDIAVGSHWEQGTKADVVMFRQYLEDLRAAVSDGIRAGRSLEELQRTIRLDKYRRFVGYAEEAFATPGLAQAIESAYASLTKYTP